MGTRCERTFILARSRIRYTHLLPRVGSISLNCYRARAGLCAISRLPAILRVDASRQTALAHFFSAIFSSARNIFQNDPSRNRSRDLFLKTPFFQGATSSRRALLKIYFQEKHRDSNNSLTINRGIFIFIFFFLGNLKRKLITKKNIYISRLGFNNFKVMNASYVSRFQLQVRSQNEKLLSSSAVYPRSSCILYPFRCSMSYERERASLLLRKLTITQSLIIYYVI